jgi:hypothetical protein
MSSPTREATGPRIPSGDDVSGADGALPGAEEVSIVKILDYIRSTFTEEAVLDSLPLEAAANPGAYHAWRTYRAPKLQSKPSPTPGVESPASDQEGDAVTLSRNRRPGEWNWEGVWEDRVNKAIKASLSEPALFTEREDIVRFVYVLAEEMQSLTRTDPLSGQ